MCGVSQQWHDPPEIRVIGSNMCEGEGAGNKAQRAEENEMQKNRDKRQNLQQQQKMRATEARNSPQFWEQPWKERATISK